MATVKVALETGAKRTFAIALDWPGWARAGKSEEEALANLADYASRYAKAVGAAELARATFDVVERLKGSAGTDFGVPSATARADRRSLTAVQLDRERRLLEAAWKAFDGAARRARGRELRLGPRGGGRGLEKMEGHVMEAEEAYLTQLGSRRPKPAAEGLAAHMKQVRAAVLQALEARAHGRQPPEPNAVRKLWTPRYFVRRSAWHALDHAWELEDRII
jgi:hypothetical protein